LEVVIDSLLAPLVNRRVCRISKQGDEPYRKSKMIKTVLLAACLMSACQSNMEKSLMMEHRSSPASGQELSAFEGLYRYRDGETLAIVADGERLIAIIGEAKYPLRAIAADTFANAGGDIIPFIRSKVGRVEAFKEKGDIFMRLSDIVEVETRALLKPRSVGIVDSPEPYRCIEPPVLTDDIRVGKPGPQTLSCDVGTNIVNGILDGTYPDVRAIAVHHKGMLVLEEYFYGYDRDRQHQMRSLTKSVISLLAGAAVDRGLLRADEPVLARLNYTSVANLNSRKERITLNDLLSNKSGLACDDHDKASLGNEVKLYDSTDWPKAFIDLPTLFEPGTVGLSAAVVN
jgi:hypothetical protein